VFAAVVTAAYLPFVSAGWWLFDSMWLMAGHWSFNGSLADGLLWLLPGVAARWVLAGLLAGLLVLSAWKGRDLLDRLVLSMLAFVVCTTTLFPWYLVWMMPLLVLRPHPALVFLCFIAPLVEMVVIDYHLQQVWELPLWVQLVEYLPFYGLLIYERLRSSPSLAEKT
jgi:hypothetical protein